MATALELSFLTSEVLDARITASGGANGTRVNNAGVIVAATCPRYDYDPVTRAPKGLLIEEARTNLLTYSDDFRNTAAAGATRPWTYSVVTLQANAALAPDGTMTADKIQETATTSAFPILCSPGMDYNTTYTFSVYAKAGERGWLILNIYSGTTSCWTYFDLINGVVGTISGGVAVASIKPAGNGWYRCTLTYTTAATGGPNIGIWAAAQDNVISYPGTSGSGVYIWGAQLEAAGFASSYIPTVDAAVTRSADQATMTGTNFSNWFNATEGTFVCEYSLPTIGFSRVLFYARNSADTNLIDIEMGGGNQPTGYVYSGAQQAAMATAAVTAGAVHVSGVAYKQDNMATATDGAAPVADSLGNIPGDLDRLAFGRANTTGYINGHFRRLVYDNTRRSNADLQAITVSRSGAASIVEGADTVTATGIVKIKATGAITEGEDTAAGSGEVGVPAVVPASRTLVL